MLGRREVQPCASWSLLLLFAGWFGAALAAGSMPPTLAQANGGNPFRVFRPLPFCRHSLIILQCGSCPGWLCTQKIERTAFQTSVQLPEEAHK